MWATIGDWDHLENSAGACIIFLMRRLVLFIVITIAGCQPMSDSMFLDYGRAFFLPSLNNGANNLFIAIESRMRISTGEEYWLLAPHPRETTFNDDGRIFKDMLDLEQGASDIIFIIRKGGDGTVIERRYDVPGQPANYLHSQGSSPYGKALHYEPRQAPAWALREMMSYSDIYDAARRGAVLFATSQYVTTDGTNDITITLDYPVKVLNLNAGASTAPVGKQWQLASPPVPFWLPGQQTPSLSIRHGYLAVGEFGADLQFVYLCEVTAPRPSQDYSCAINFPGSTRIFERQF